MSDDLTQDDLPTVDPRTLDLLRQMEEENKRLQPRITALMAADPQMKPWTAMTIAQDEASVERAREAIAEGKDPLYAVHLVGSYARFGAAVELLPSRILYANILDLWRGADPDDSDPRFLSAWKRAKAYRNPARYLKDGKGIPGNTASVMVYRGQDPGAPSGIAWSTSFTVAEKFATGAATRQRDREGIVLSGFIKRNDVIAYLTLRGEEEVVCDPADIRDIEPIAAYRRESKDGA
jgi:hypothetical protein